MAPKNPFPFPPSRKESKKSIDEKGPMPRPKKGKRPMPRPKSK